MHVFVYYHFESILKKSLVYPRLHRGYWVVPETETLSLISCLYSTVSSGGIILLKGRR